MRLFIKSFLVGAALCSMVIPSVSVQASIFFIEDKDDRFTISFPDLWKKVGNQKPDDKLTFTGPGQYDFAGCRVRVNKDRRFVIYPSKFDDEIQRTAVSDEFWDDYLSAYNDVTISRFSDNAGLGFGHASFVEASYETAEGAAVKKRGLMFASLYHDQLYVVDCASEQSVYHKWRPTFLSIVKSVDFGKVTSERKNGHYRGFMDDAPVEVNGPKPFDKYKF